MTSSEFRIRLNTRAVLGLTFIPETMDMLHNVGEQTAGIARILAPKATGAGAESIHGEVGTDTRSGYVDISWDRDHFYMLFKEVGSEHEPARPFLRPALDQTRV